MVAAIETDPLQQFLDRLDDVRQTGNGQYMARCPAHDDRHASLSLSRGEGGRALLHCHAGCSNMAICRALNLPMSALFSPNREDRRRLVATYDYRDAEGTLLFQSVRYEPKSFSQRRPDGHGGWINSLDGVPRVLYRLPELLDADPSRPVLVSEGEADVDSLRDIGFVATTNPMGAGKWSKLDDDSALVGRHVVILPDDDEPGRRHAWEVAQALHGRAASVKVVALPGAKDARDWIRAGGTADQLHDLIDAAPLWTPAGAPPPPEPPPEPQGVELGSRDPATGKIVLSQRRTLPTARAFLREFYTHPSGGLTLWEYAGGLVVWQDNRYRLVPDARVKKGLQGWLHDALRHHVDRSSGLIELVPFECNPGTVAAALETIRTHVHLSPDTPQPSWLGDAAGRPPADEILPCRTMNLHIPSRQIIPATPALFTPTALGFDYHPNAPEPMRWLRFLQDVWSDDPASIRLLQEWFGYCLTVDTSRQKMMLMVGPKRSGKGTISKVLTRLIGAGNVANPTISGLASQFGLQSLIGKSLGVVSDARFSGKDTATVVERLLCISGEDALTIDRKYLDSLTLKLPTRLMFLSNELPRLSEVSGALAGRFVLLRFTKSFYGHEDRGLLASLESELPGILLWALEGWQRLRSQAAFTLPESSRELADQLDDLLSPTLAFVRESCILSPECQVTTQDLYRAWTAWCKTNGRESPGTAAWFARDLLAAVSGLHQSRNHSTGRFYRGITLKPGLPY